MFWNRYHICIIFFFHIKISYFEGYDLFIGDNGINCYSELGYSYTVNGKSYNNE